MNMPDKNWLRTLTIIEKIPIHKTTYKSAIYVKLDYRYREDGSKEILGLRFSEKGKDGMMVDRLLTAIGDTATTMIREAINADEDVKRVRQIINENRGY